MKLDGLTILLVSNEPWGIVWLSKHHYAAELAKRNRVIFLDPPLRWDWKKSLTTSFQEDKIFPGLSVLRYSNPLPRAVTGPAFSLNAWLVARRLGAFLRRSDAKPDLIFTFDPFRPLSPRVLGARYSIYYIADNYETPRERAVLRVADTVLAISPELAVRDLDERRRVANVIPHGVPENGFEEDALVQPSVGHGIISCGTFGPRNDWDILLAVAKHFPASALRLVGPVVTRGMSEEDKGKLEELRAMPNVVFAGIKSYPEMSRDIAAASVGICAYKKSNSTAATSSVLKNIQYLSFGRPVVSTPVHDPRLAPGFVWMAGNPEEFIKALDHVLSAPHDPDLARARIAFTKELSYAKLIERIEGILD